MTVKNYNGMIPPCGVFCGTCPRYQNPKRPCPGAEIHCLTRKCKSLYACCVEKRKLTHCHQCPIFPCHRFKKFAAGWLALGQDLVGNQSELAELGEKRWLEKFNAGEGWEGEKKPGR